MKLISEKHPIITCFIWVLFAYLPVVSFQFAIKNDFFSAYFPLKYFLSESIHSGIFPLWNPFLNYGFPVYGDMSLAYWNPLTWLVASTTGYNPWTFTIELILYLFVACRGMYSLSGIWMESLRARQLSAVVYTCSGFFIGHLQHFNWITGAALLPLCISMLIKFTRGGELRYFLASVLSWSWLLTSAHPGITIGAGLFMIPLFLYLRSFRRKEIFRIALTAMAILLVCTGMIYAYLEVIPFTNRAGTVGSLVNSGLSTGLRSWISMLMSFPTSKAEYFFGNDIAMRNCFFGMLLLASLIMIVRRTLKGPALYFLCSGCVFLILSSELVLSFYRYIPLVNFVRLNSEFRIFAILSFILAGGIALEHTIKNKDGALLGTLKSFRILYALATLSAVAYILIKGESLFTLIGDSMNSRAAIKLIINDLSFADTVAIHGTIQLIICSILIIALKQFDINKVYVAGFAEILIAALINLPFTGVGQRSVQDLDLILDKAPKGVIAQKMFSEEEEIREYPQTDLVIGPWSLYSKQVAMDSLFPYPLMFRSTLGMDHSDVREPLKSKAPIFLTSGAVIREEQVRYSFQSIIIRTISTANDRLVIKQNLYPKWQVKLDGTPSAIHAYAGSLIAVDVPAGEHQIELAFRNSKIRALLFMEFFFILTILTGLLLTWKDQRIRYIFP